MRTKKSVLILFTLFIVFVVLLTACNTETDNQSEDSDTGSGVSESSVESVADNESEASEPDEQSDQVSEAEESKEPIHNEPTEHLSILASTLTDNNCFVVVGKCEEGAVITATTETQSVTTGSDKGFYSVRLNKEGTETRVTITATGTVTEQYTEDIKPVVPNSDMWPIVGGNEYNFFFQSMMPDFMHETSMSDFSLDSLTNRIKDRISRLNEELPGTEIVYMVVPSKASIYPELVPEDYPQGTKKSRLEQVNKALEDAGATVINLLDVYKEHKEDEYKIYWGTDSHWTDYSAFIAYTELFNHISDRFPAAAPRKEIEFDFIGDYYNGGDMIYYMMMDQNIMQEYCHYRKPRFSLNSDIASVPRYRAENYLMYSENTAAERVFHTGQSGMPNLYVMRDSFGAHIYDILADRSNTTVYKSMWAFTYNIGDIKQYSPDYIIYIMSEWNIDNIIKG